MVLTKEDGNIHLPSLGNSRGTKPSGGTRLCGGGFGFGKEQDERAQTRTRRRAY